MLNKPSYLRGQRRKHTHGAFCVYCGSRAQTKEHFPPASISRSGWVFPCCYECNSLAGTAHAADFDKRVQYVKNKLHKRNASLVRQNWDVLVYLAVLGVEDICISPSTEQSELVAPPPPAKQRHKPKVIRPPAVHAPRVGKAYEHKGPPRACLYCPVSFVPRSPNQYKCTPECGVWYTFTCRQCGAEGTAWSGHRSQPRRRFCDKSCSGAYNAIQRARWLK